MIKKNFLLAVILITLLNVQFASSINLLVSSEPVVPSIINDWGKPGVFNIRITNNEQTSKFEIFTYERFRINPNEFSLQKGETKTIRFEFYPIDSMVNNVGHVKVPFFMKEKNLSENQRGDIVVKLISFKDAFDVKADNINPDSNAVKISFYNKEDIKYENMNVVFASNFFDDKSESFTLSPYEKKEFTIPFNGNFKKLVAGTYSIRATYTAEGKTESFERPVKILEKTGLSIEETSGGLIIRTNSIKKTNEGNIPTIAEISIRKNIISRLFTTFSLEPARIERTGFFVDYFWQRELPPSESIEIKIATNWIFPLLLAVAVIIIIFLFNLYISTHLVLRKQVYFVKTKGGEFALRVVLRAKAKKYMEKVVINDRLPGMAKIYEKFGTMPDKIDRERGFLRWDVPHLGKGEERVFSYVIYSKMKVVGKFELPTATAFYEIQGKVHESKSNKVFFINEAGNFSGE